MHKHLVTALLVGMSLLFVAVGIVAVALSGAVTGSSPAVPSVFNRGGQGAAAKCSELKIVKDLKLSQGAWVLQEKLEFPDGMLYHNTVPSRDQSVICLRTEFVDITDKQATLQTGFFLSNRLFKNFTGWAKVKDNGHWDFHMLAKDHEGMVVDMDPNKYFVLIECVKGINSAANADANVPASVFLYTRGNLAESEMSVIRRKVEDLLRHRDEFLLDFGAECYLGGTTGGAETGGGGGGHGGGGHGGGGHGSSGHLKSKNIQQFL